MGIGAAIIGGSIVSGLFSAKAASKAAKAGSRGVSAGLAQQERFAQLGIEENRRQFEQTKAELQRGQRRSSLALQAGGRIQRAELSPFSTAGVEALNRQRSLLGFGGQEEQQAAFAAFGDSPGQRFLQQRAQKNLLRNAAAIGGIGGGNIRGALVQQGVGFAQQDFANEFARLQQLSGRGQEAATDLGRGALSTAAQRSAGILSTAGNIGRFGAQSATNISNILGGQGAAQQAGLQQIGQIQAGGILDRNQALQAGFGGVLTGAAQSGFFDTRDQFTAPEAGRGFFDTGSQFTLPAANIDPFTRTA